MNPDVIDWLFLHAPREVWTRSTVCRLSHPLYTIYLARDDSGVWPKGDLRARLMEAINLRHIARTRLYPVLSIIRAYVNGH